MPSAIEIRGVSKRFRLYHEQFTSLKERMLHGGRMPYEDFWALQGIDFSVNEGETFGLLGHNGSGKSTLLKCIAGIIQPSTGEIVTRGRVAALLELGAGFQPELSGRENIYLNASLLGMSRKFVDARFDDIVSFAELEPFIDNQVRYYSSGMYVRLGFAVAVHMDPAILIVDEVLAVGDELFQRKCLDRVKQFQREGRTIVVVTHAPDQVRQVCSKAAVLDHGRVVGLGTPSEAVRSYREHLLMRDEYAEASPLGALLDLAEGGQEGQAADSSESADKLSTNDRDREGLKISWVHIDHDHYDERRPVMPGETLRVKIGYHAPRAYDDVVPSYSVYDQDGRLLWGTTAKLIANEVSVAAGDGEFVFEIERVPLLDGDYPVTVGLTSHDESTIYDWHEQRYHFSVTNPGTSVGLVAVNTTVWVRQGNSPLDLITPPVTDPVVG